METKEHDKIIAFDTLYTNNHIQMLKIVMPYFDGPMQKMLAVYIKYLEFRHTLDRYRLPSYELNGCSSEKKEFDIGKICSELLPFCTPEEKKRLGQIAEFFRSMEMYKEMSRTMEMMKEFAPDLFNDGPGGIGNLFSSGSSHENQPDGTDNDTADQSNSRNNGMMEMLMGMLSPEQKAMFEMFGGNNPHESERMDE